MTQDISLKVEITLINHLNEILKDEQSALVNNDIDAVENLLDQKAKLIQNLGLSAQLRYQQLTSYGFEGNEVGMVAWLTKQVAKRAEWSVLQHALSVSKELNRVNAMLVSKFLNRNQQSLALLQTGGNQAHTNIYGPNGHAMSQRLTSGSIFG